MEKTGRRGWPTCTGESIVGPIERNRRAESGSQKPMDPLPRPLGPDVDIAVVRVPHEAVASSLQLPIQLVEHDVTEQWRKRAPLRSPFHARTHQSILPNHSIQEG